MCAAHLYQARRWGGSSPRRTHTHIPEARGVSVLSVSGLWHSSPHNGEETESHWGCDLHFLITGGSLTSPGLHVCICLFTPIFCPSACVPVPHRVVGAPSLPLVVVPCGLPTL